MASHPAGVLYIGIPSRHNGMVSLPARLPTRANECGGLVQALRDTQLTDHLDPSDALCTVCYHSCNIFCTGPGRAKMQRATATAAVDSAALGMQTATRRRGRRGCVCVCVCKRVLSRWLALSFPSTRCMVEGWRYRLQGDALLARGPGPIWAQRRLKTERLPQCPMPQVNAAGARHTQSPAS